MEKGLKFYYDEEGDVLDVSIGAPEEAITRELKDDLLVRVDPETEEVEGFTILNFEKTSKQGIENFPIKADLSLEAKEKTKRR